MECRGTFYAQTTNVCISISNLFNLLYKDPGVPSEDKAHGHISVRTYVKYFRAGANYLFLLTVLVLILVAEVR